MEFEFHNLSERKKNKEKEILIKLFLELELLAILLFLNNFEFEYSSFRKLVFNGEANSRRESFFLVGKLAFGKLVSAHVKQNRTVKVGSRSGMEFLIEITRRFKKIVHSSQRLIQVSKQVYWIVKRVGEGHSSLMFKQLLLANFHGLSDYYVCYGKLTDKNVYFFTQHLSYFDHFKDDYELVKQLAKVACDYTSSLTLFQRDAIKSVITMLNFTLEDYRDFNFGNILSTAQWQLRVEIMMKFIFHLRRKNGGKKLLAHPIYIAKYYLRHCQKGRIFSGTLPQKLLLIWHKTFNKIILYKEFYKLSLKTVFYKE
ncbi:hypothetical protein WN51_13888 [Melipona quadrifasciata]|uniref:Uncharacterized protein n=1 Tax=Melipona quadrifasciata TaxID=166423 RepID=A0A0M8ZYP8_9HYME|nr:hypothetical protein WN51_13888 [Melipona quadrifasciata]